MNAVMLIYIYYIIIFNFEKNFFFNDNNERNLQNFLEIILKKFERIWFYYINNI